MKLSPPNPLSAPIWREGRLGLDLAALVRDPVFRGEGMADGRGQPVLLIPGFLAGDGSLRVMGRWLKSTGHYPKRAGIRVNVGCSGAGVVQLEERLEELVRQQGQRAAIVGQSRGGHFAKVLARRRPDLVSGIVTLGSPQLDPFAINPVIWTGVMAVGALGTLGARGLFNHGCLEGECCSAFWEDTAGDLPRGVGYVSVYSRRDGVVDWRSCLDNGAEHVEIRSSHCGMAVHPGAFRAVAEALKDFRRRDARSRRRVAAPAPRLRKAA
jgi:triacylglycerol lipase